jgi:hypothetical protein
MNCEAELATRAQARKAAKELGDDYVNSLLGRRKSAGLPQVQGCQCYNVQDNLFGRQLTNTSDPYECLCNMSTYGQRPAQVDQCSCYNVENMTNGSRFEYRDMTGASCRNYQQTPIDKALAYLKDIENRLDSLTDEELKKINSFIDAQEIVESKQQQLEDIQNIRKTVEN